MFRGLVEEGLLLVMSYFWPKQWKTMFSEEASGSFYMKKLLFEVVIRQ